jgi:hypothetical protein
MNHFSFYFLMTALLSSSVYAQEEMTLEQKLAMVKLEQRQAEVMIKKMHSRGRLDAEEAIHAKREIASVKEDDVKQIRVEATSMLKSSKSLATK